ncbi:biotin--[acetyl-CoA-carboxylase] ligase [Chitinasiproducens palmae]|uniref:biotin--[biotin carboxyl-carrier protein] ligase n=1 Tax=Chitinasiproducens palmae TaxID=1770053 RepID=A0A1H2PPV6_9BURK|nr:biotin--[acetyl-CoA-carboxylase] ligase [Chitinasiproducens palmae]SDV48366.1 BirA family transcriptional regulator, biotin operon repressor / biotin-[acetyl-CoA-carboxylase] ligase [Chitinasiproducens palmae]
MLPSAPTASAAPDDVPGDAHFDLARARARLAADALTADWQLSFVSETGSTNADLLARLGALTRVAADADPLSRPAQAPRPECLVAGTQRAGRGRQGRPWQSPPGNGLLCSTAMVVEAPVGSLSSLSLVAGAALVTALRSLPLTAPERIALKWPNDVLLDGRKLAGILIELAAARHGRAALVIGVGINLRATPVATPPAVADRAAGAATDAQHATAPTAPSALSALTARSALSRASLDELIAATPDFAGDVLVAWLVELARSIALFERAGFAPFRDVWWRNHAYAGQAVTLFDQGQPTLGGIAAGIDETGRLLIDDGTSVRPVSSGDLSLRLSTQP